MAKIHFDSDVFEKKIYPNISSAKNNLSNARSTLNYSYIPYDFVYRNSLKNYIYSIDAINRNLDTFNLWASTTKSKIEQAEQDFKNDLDKIDVEELKQRDKLI